MSSRKQGCYTSSIYIYLLVINHYKYFKWLERIAITETLEGGGVFKNEDWKSRVGNVWGSGIKLKTEK